MAAEEAGMSQTLAGPNSGVMQHSPVRQSGGEARTSGCSVAKQLNKLKSFLATLQAYKDPNEDEHTIRSRRKRIDIAIDSLVSCAIHIEQFFAELKACGYPITESEIAAVQPVVKNGLPLLKAEIKNATDASRLDRPHINDHGGPPDEFTKHSSPYDRRRGDRQARMDIEPSAKRSFPAEGTPNGQVARFDLHESLQAIHYQMQVLVEQVGGILYALRSQDDAAAAAASHATAAMPPGVEVARPGGPPPPPSAYSEPRSSRPPLSKSSSPPPPQPVSSGRAMYHVPPSMARIPPGHHIAMVPAPYLAQAPGQVSHHQMQEMKAMSKPMAAVQASTSSSQPQTTSGGRKESSKTSSKHREDGTSLSKKHRATASEQSCWSCGATASETCSRCKKARYCGPICQRMDWNEKHHRDCKSPAKATNGQ